MTPSAIIETAFVEVVVDILQWNSAERSLPHLVVMSCTPSTSMTSNLSRHQVVSRRSAQEILRSVNLWTTVTAKCCAWGEETNQQQEDPPRPPRQPILSPGLLRLLLLLLLRLLQRLLLLLLPVTHTQILRSRVGRMPLLRCGENVLCRRRKDSRSVV